VKDKVLGTDKPSFGCENLVRMVTPSFLKIDTIHFLMLSAGIAIPQ
jgi:hypothetical protein